MRLLFYDVETANSSDIGSICSVGWVLYENDSEIQTGYSLINPHCPFAKYNVGVHGITADTVVAAPSFGEYWKNSLCEVMSDSIVVAHGADFDLSATEQALYSAGIEDPGIYYFDSLAIFKNMFSAQSYKLPYLAETVNYQYQCHNALEDAKALAYVMLFMREMFHAPDLATLLLKSGISSKNTLSNNYEPHSIENSIRPQMVIAHNSNSSRFRGDVELIDHLFSGLRFCFTGEIEGYERADLEKILKQHDGRMTSSVSNKTDYLVVGSYEVFGDGYVSGKQKTAMDLIANGAKVKIISPSDFFALLNHEKQ